jgi:4-aminobutyrate aminotransferase
MIQGREYISPVWSRGADIYVERGEGSYIFTSDGRKLLDFTCGIGVTNTGHCHPRVVKAVQEQATKLLHGQANIVIHQPLLQLIHEMRAIVPKQLDGFFFSNSGAEAVEGAIKLARMATGRTNIIVFQGSFHGRTVGTMSLTTSKTIYRAGYQPLMPGVFVAPYPYAYRFGWDDEVTSQWCLNELEFLLQTQTAPEETAAILIEPVLGEGGYVVPPNSFMMGVQEIAKRHEILLIADEVQSGFGRTGKWFGLEHFEFEPDIITIAKGLASGLPLSGVVASMDLMKKWVPGSHGGTYGGNAVAAAAAVETIRVITEEKLLENAHKMGILLMTGLGKIQEEFPVLGDVRGLGLMIGAEFSKERHKPAKTFAKKVAKHCLEEGLMLLTCGPWENTLRLIPPLNVTESQVETALTTVRNVIQGLANDNDR